MSALPFFLHGAILVAIAREGPYTPPPSLLKNTEPPTAHRRVDNNGGPGPPSHPHRHTRSSPGGEDGHMPRTSEGTPLFFSPPFPPLYHPATGNNGDYHGRWGREPSGLDFDM